MSSPDLDHLNSWHYELPPELIATRPAARRDGGRLMVIDPVHGRIQHSMIDALPEFLRTDDVLVFNNTRVLPARLFGHRTATGGRWEGLFVEELAAGRWLILCETRGKLRPGETVSVRPAAGAPPTGQITGGDGGGGGELEIRLLEKWADGSWVVEVPDHGPAQAVLEQFGSLPLPPYMGRREADADDERQYQTIFASEPGAVAAPTAGLHFTQELLHRCRRRGIRTAEVTLHVGIGTFRPISGPRLSEHQMHDEWCRVPQSACDEIGAARAAGGRTVAVGTTSVRSLEAAADVGGGALTSWQGRTRLFIRPSYQFRVVDCLLTNFHLPGSTLLVLVAAMAGYDLIREAYRQAIAERYRFYSYGDAMLILRDET